MKTIYKIARTELQTLFYSPIAWLILVIFTFQASMAFTNGLAGNVRSQELGYGLYNVTMGVFAGWRGMFIAMQQYLYLYIPLLTMGLMSREFSSGSIKLLYSSPITSTQIVLGKYLSMMLYGLIMLAIVTVYVVFYMFVLKDFDYPVAITGLIGIYLIMCLYSAVGLFVSCLTSYQVVAAIGTFAALTILQVIGGVLQGVDFKGGGAAGALPPLHHGGQPGPVSPGAGAIPDHVPGDLLPPVRAGGMDRGGRAGI